MGNVLKLDNAVPNRHERRDTPRYRARKVAIVLESAMFLEPVSLIDIGRRGYSVRTDIAYAPGTHLRLHVPGLDPIEGSAVWHSGNKLGARFSEPIANELVLSLSARD